MLKIFYRVGLAILFASFIHATKAQVFGGLRPSLKWYQIKTDSLRIVFPKSLLKEAKEISQAGHWALQHQQSLGNKHKSITILLQHQTTISNGYVGLAPRRSEFFMMPELSNYQLTSIPWHIQLTLHELRHISQFNNFNRGFPKGMGLFLGEQGSAIAMNAIIPNWFWEGDAVNQETKMSAQGRGRLPYFYNGYRSLWLENKKYGYQKLRNGSLKDYVPDHYQLGYLLVNFAERKYGADIWKRITHSALNVPSIFYPFQHAVKKHTKLSYPKFVRKAFEYHQDSFSITRQSTTPGLITRKERANVLQYAYPQLMEEGTILALKSGYRQIPQWVQIDSVGKEKFLRVKDISQDDYFTYRNGMVVYTAYQTHPRWGWENYSVIRCWDMNADSVRQLSFQSRLFQPDLSTDKQWVVAVHSGIDMQSALALIQTTDQSLRYLPNPNGFTFTYPRFTTDGKAVVTAVRNKVGDMGIIRVNIADNHTDTLLPFNNHPISFLQLSKDKVFFTATQQGSDALYCLQTDNLQLYEIKTLPNGVYQSYYDTASSYLYWVTQNASGMHIGKDKMEESSMRGVDKLNGLTEKDPGFNADNDYLQQASVIAKRNDEVKPYRKGLHLLYPHSWRPILFEPDYGLQIFSDNVMNTLQSELNYNYNRNEQSHTAGMNLFYGGWYPQLFAGITQTWNRNILLDNETVILNESGWRGGVFVPLTFVPGKTIHRLDLNASLQVDQVQYQGASALKFPNENFSFQSVSFNWSHRNQQARQHIFPRWAQSLRVQYRSTVSGDWGNQLFVNAGIYLPGLLPNHHVVGFVSWQGRDTLRGDLFSNNLAFSRGYNAVNLPRAFRWSANYHFPILYPDFGVANLMYFMRVRANLFYDYTELKSLRTGRHFSLRSAGAELFFDTRLWNQFPLSFGIRYSRLLNKDLVNPNLDPNQFELVLPMNIL